LDTEEKFTSESKAEEEEEAQERKQSKAKRKKKQKTKPKTKEFTKMSHKLHKFQDDKTTVPLYFNSKIRFFFFCLLQNGSGSKQNGTLRFRFRFF